jgi:hypothetical protein
MTFKVLIFKGIVKVIAVFWDICHNISCGLLFLLIVLVFELIINVTNFHIKG